jgi:hypothetical protein
VARIVARDWRALVAIAPGADPRNYRIQSIGPTIKDRQTEQKNETLEHCRLSGRIEAEQNWESNESGEERTGFKISILLSAATFMGHKTQGTKQHYEFKIREERFK